MDVVYNADERFAEVFATSVLSLFENNKEGVCYSISMTTRPPRPSEKDGVNYYFVSRETFEESVKNGEFLEWAEYSGNLYGTSKKFVQKNLDLGNNVMLEIETKGAKKVMELFPDCVTIFFTPPSLEELEHRLKGRCTECDEVIQKRLLCAKDELNKIDKYKYNIINDKVEEAYTKLQAIYDFETGKGGNDV